MESTFLLLAPFVVALLTGWFKQIPLLDVRSNASRAALIRLCAAALSLGAAALVQWSGGDSVSITSIETFADTLVVFLGASGVYFFSKQK